MNQETTRGVAKGPRTPRVLEATDAEIRKQTLHRLRHRDLYRRRGVRAGDLQSCRLHWQLILYHSLPTLRGHARLLEDRGLQC